LGENIRYKNYVKPGPQGSDVVVELDEMWHYLRSKKFKSGFGKLIVAMPINLSTGNVVDEIRVHLPSFTRDC
jgi:hypothetical protein